MTIIAVAGEKGGCCKTTIATNIAVFLDNDGCTVGILDADPNPAASRFVKRRDENLQDHSRIECKRATGDIDHTIQGMAKDYDHVIIDCGGFDSLEARYAMALGDIFISPFQPSVYDLETAKAIDDLTTRAMVFNPELKAYALLVAVSNNVNSRLKKEAFQELNKLKSLTCMRACTHQLEIWRTTAAKGLGVIETDQKKAFGDIIDIMQELKVLNLSEVEHAL